MRWPAILPEVLLLHGYCCRKHVVRRLCSVQRFFVMGLGLKEESRRGLPEPGLLSFARRGPEPGLQRNPRPGGELLAGARGRQNPTARNHEERKPGQPIRPLRTLGSQKHRVLQIPSCRFSMGPTHN